MGVLSAAHPEEAGKAGRASRLIPWLPAATTNSMPACSISLRPSSIAPAGARVGGDARCSANGHRVICRQCGRVCALCRLHPLPCVRSHCPPAHHGPVPLTGMRDAAPGVAADVGPLLLAQPQALECVGDGAKAVVPDEAAYQQADVHGNACHTQPAAGQDGHRGLLHSSRASLRSMLAAIQLGSPLHNPGRCPAGSPESRRAPRLRGQPPPQRRPPTRCCPLRR